jgi:predicted Zn-ribbon and HTH transcriptional regulator
MELEKGIVIHISDEAKENWERKEKPIKYKSNCPSCKIQKLKDYNNKEIKNEISGE